MVSRSYAAAQEVLDALDALGIAYDDVIGDPGARGRGEVRGVLARAARERRDAAGGRHGSRPIELASTTDR